MSEDFKQELADYAAKVRATYFAERQLYLVRTNPNQSVTDDLGRRHNIYWDGGIDQNGRRHKPVWPKIVANALNHGIDPCDLVTAVFKRTETGEPPQPSRLCGPAAISIYNSYKPQIIDNLQYEFESFKQSAKQEMWKLAKLLDADVVERWRLVILSPTLAGSAIFRYVLACNTGQADLARRCKHAAMVEYLRCPDEYNTVLKEHLPPEFSQDALQLRDNIKIYVDTEEAR